MSSFSSIHRDRRQLPLGQPACVLRVWGRAEAGLLWLPHHESSADASDLIRCPSAPFEFWGMAAQAGAAAHPATLSCICPPSSAARNPRFCHSHCFQRGRGLAGGGSHPVSPLLSCSSPYRAPSPAWPSSRSSRRRPALRSGVPIPAPHRPDACCSHLGYGLGSSPLSISQFEFSPCSPVLFFFFPPYFSTCSTLPRPPRLVLQEQDRVWIAAHRGADGALLAPGARAGRGGEHEG